MQSSRAERSSSSWPLPVWAEIVLLTLLPLLVYSPSLTYDILRLDDDLYYLHYPELHAGAWPGPIDVWKQPFASEYFPVTATTLWIDLALFGSKSWTGARVHQILWFVVAILAVRALVLRLTGRRDFAWWAALLYALHPVCSESVIWLAQRKNLVAQACVFWSIERYIAMRQAGTLKIAWGRGVASWLLCVAAILSKTQGVCVPAVLMVYEVLLGRGPKLSRLASWAPFAAASGVFVALYPIYISEALVGPMLGGSRLASFANTGWIVARYLLHTAVPTGLSFYYAVDWFGASSLAGWMGWLIVLSAIGLAIALAVDRKLAAFFWLGGLAALAPALNLVRQPIPMTDHYNHWALWGWITGGLLAVHGIATRFKDLKLSLAPFAVSMLALLFGILTFVRVPEFQSMLTVLTAAVRNQPGSAWGQASYVNVLTSVRDAGLRAQAGPHALMVFACADAQMINPADRANSIREAAFYLQRLGKKEEAHDLIERESAFLEPPWFRDALKAELALRMGHPAEASRLLEPEFQRRFAFLSSAIQAFRDGSSLPHRAPPLFQLSQDRADDFSAAEVRSFVVRLVKILALAHLTEKNYEAAFPPAVLWSNLNPHSADARECLAKIYEGLNLPVAAARMRQQ